LGLVPHLIFQIWRHIWVRKMSLSRERLQFKRGRMMRTSLICIQCNDWSLEHMRDSWISRYVLTLSIIFQNLRLVPCIFYWLGTMERTSKNLEKAKDQGGGARMSTPRRSPCLTRLWLHLGFQNLTSPKLMPWPHTESDLDVLYMVGTRIL
jgi:hypothetical protein